MELALTSDCQDSDTISLLLAAGPAVLVLQALLRYGEAAQPLFADFVELRLPLSEAEWALVPAPCRSLGRALTAALAHSSAQASRLVQRLPPADVERLRTAALCLARAQRRALPFCQPILCGTCSPSLTPEILGSLLNFYLRTGMVVGCFSPMFPDLL